MMKRTTLAVLFGVGFVANVWAADPECKCPANEVRNGWCDACGVGYVAGVKIESAALFHAIDAHGHQTRPESLRCATCRSKIETDGFCETCRTGYVNKEAYFSRLTYLLAKGKLKRPASVTCPTCRNHAKAPGWCERCNVGMVGHIEFHDKDLFSQAVVAYNVLKQAIEYVDTCQSCAIAMAVDRKCHRCKKSYKAGKVVESKKATE